MLGPADMGHRVVVRRRAGHRGDRLLFTDALGELTGLTDTDLTVVTRTGPVTIARSDVVAAKRVPPRPVSRRQIAALEAAANEAWPAPVQEPLGQWLLRAAGGWSNRANSALATGDPGLPLPAAVAEVERWYREHDLPPAIATPLPAAARVDAHLRELGWQPGRAVLVQAASLAVVPRMPHPPAGEPGPVRLMPAPTRAWLALAASPYRSAAPGPLPAAALRVLTTEGRVPVRFAHLHAADGDLIAAGRGTITGAGRWLGLSRMVVAPAARRRGLARRLVAALVDWAGQEGATDAFLQVEEGNAAALGLYTGLGFRTHHSYVTWVSPGPDGGAGWTAPARSPSAAATCDPGRRRS